jgi:hypothetical protein
MTTVDTTATEQLGQARAAADAARDAALQLRQRAMSGDPKVSGAQLSAADSEVELAELRVGAAEQAARAEQEATRVRILHEGADRYLADEPKAVEQFVKALGELRQAINAVLVAGGVHADVCAEARQLASTYSSGESTDRLAAPPGPYGQPTVDRHPIRDIPVQEWLRQVLDDAIKRAPTCDPGTSLYPTERN